MKRTRLQALHSFVIYLRACLSQIVSSTSSWLVRGGFIGEFLTAVEGVNRRCTELLAHKIIIVVGRSFTVNSCVVDELIRENTEKCVSYRARLKNSENFLTLHLSGRKQTIQTQLLNEVVERIIREEVFFCDENVHIRPTENNGSVDDIVYKILLGDQVRVRVIFYTVAELECLCSSDSGQDSTSEDQANAFLRSLLQDDVVSRAAGFVPELQQSIKYRERSEYVKKFSTSLEYVMRESHLSPIDIHTFLGETLTYMPCMDNIPNLLDAHILKAKSFINRCLLKRNAIWSIVKEVVLEVPSKSEQMKGTAYVNLRLPDETDMENQSNAVRLMDSANTIIYTCDERKIDGGFRRLFKHTSFMKQLSMHNTLHKLYVIVVSSSQLVLTQNVTILRKQLCEAKNMEVQSMLKHAGKEILSRITTACVIGGARQIRQGISEIVAELNTSDNMHHTSLKRRIYKLEEIISQVCDDLHATTHTFIQFRTLKEEHYAFFASQHTASLTVARLMNPTTSFGKVHFDTIIGSWRRRWLITFTKKNSSAIVQCLKKCGEDVQTDLSLTSCTNFGKFNLSHLDERSCKKRKRFPPLRKGEVSIYSFLSTIHFSLSNHLDFRTTAITLKNLNKKMLLKLQAGILRKISFLGMHTLSTISIKRSLWAFGRRCERHFIQLMAPERMECMIKTYLSHSSYDYLSAEWHASDVKTESQRNHILDDIIFDIQTLLMSKLITIMECYCIESECLFGFGGAVSCVQNAFLHEQIRQNMNFPLYHKLNDKFMWCTNSTDRFRIQHVETDISYSGLNESTHGAYVSDKLSKNGTVCHLSRVIIESMSFIERESLQRTEFFAVWGSDLLATFYFFREISHIDSLIWQVSNNILHRLALMWLEKNANISTIASMEDFLFYNEGYYVLSRIDMENAHLGYLGSMINQRALEWDTELSEYLGLNSSTRLLPGDYSSKNTCCDKLSTAMIWSFFLRGNQLSISGTSAEEIDSLCRSVDLSQTAFTSAKQFRDVCYCITHRIFTKSSWCQFPLPMCQWQTETKFLRFYLPCLVQAADVELVGEFIQALRCVGVSELEHDMLAATTFLLNSRNTSTGGWLDENTAFETQYHATVCSIGALMKHSHL